MVLSSILFKVAILVVLYTCYLMTKYLYGSLIKLKFQNSKKGKLYGQIFLQELKETFVPLFAVVSFFLFFKITHKPVFEEINFILKIISLAIGVVAAGFSCYSFRLYCKELFLFPVDEIFKRRHTEIETKISFEKWKKKSWWYFWKR